MSCNLRRNKTLHGGRRGLRTGCPGRRTRHRKRDGTRAWCIPFWKYERALISTKEQHVVATELFLNMHSSVVIRDFATCLPQSLPIVWPQKLVKAEPRVWGCQRRPHAYG